MSGIAELGIAEGGIAEDGWGIERDSPARGPCRDSWVVALQVRCASMPPCEAPRERAPPRERRCLLASPSRVTGAEGAGTG